VAPNFAALAERVAPNFAALAEPVAPNRPPIAISKLNLVRPLARLAEQPRATCRATVCHWQGNRVPLALPVQMTSNRDVDGAGKKQS
jgi:hypothetical protein